MATYYSDASSLRKAAISLIEKTVSKKIAPLIEKKLAKSAASRVAPKAWKGAGSIDDVSVMNSEITINGHGAVKLLVTDTAKPQPSLFGTDIDTSNDTLFSEWIEYGRWMDLDGYFESGGEEKPKREARPFVEPLQREINANPSEIIGVLDKAFNGRQVK